jgi:predicted MFS family arabinose efflux permease
LAHIVGGVGALSAGYFLKRINANLGPGKVLPLGLALTGVAWCAFSVLPSHAPYNTASMGLAMFAFDFGCVCFFVNYISMRQIVTPNELLGRVTATMRFASVSLAPLGAVLTGWLAESAGLRPTLATLGVLGLLVAYALFANRTVRDASQQALKASPA